MVTQAIGVAVTVVYGFIASFIILKVIDMTIGLRATEEQERKDGHLAARRACRLGTCERKEW